MAPKRPLPMGRASTHCPAGLSYQRTRSLGGLVFSPSLPANAKCFARETVPSVADAVERKRRRGYLPIETDGPSVNQIRSIVGEELCEAISWLPPDRYSISAGGTVVPLQPF